MRIIAFSDTHGMSGAVLKLFSETYDKTDLYIFCGDGIRDIEYAKRNIRI
jgi:predicted phosphodiesterase